MEPYKTPHFEKRHLQMGVFKTQIKVDSTNVFTHFEEQSKILSASRNSGHATSPLLGGIHFGSGELGPGMAAGSGVA